MSSKSFPSLLLVTWYSPGRDVLQRVLGGVQVTTRRPDRAIPHRVSEDAVVVDLPADAVESLRTRVREWTVALVRSGTSVVVLCECNEMLWAREATEAPRAATRPRDGSARALQMSKPVRGPELRGMLSWAIGRPVTRDPKLDGRTEELLMCGVRVGQRLGLSVREMELLICSLELRNRDEISARMGVTRGAVDALAQRVAKRSSMPLEVLVRHAWLEWAAAIADDEGSGEFRARARKGSDQMVQGVEGERERRS